MAKLLIFSEATTTVLQSLCDVDVTVREARGFGPALFAALRGSRAEVASRPLAAPAGENVDRVNGSASNLSRSAAGYRQFRMESNEVKIVARQSEMGSAQNNLHACRVRVRKSY